MSELSDSSVPEKGSQLPAEEDNKSLQQQSYDNVVALAKDLKSRQVANDVVMDGFLKAFPLKGISNNRPRNTLPDDQKIEDREVAVISTTLENASRNGLSMSEVTGIFLEIYPVVGMLMKRAINSSPHSQAGDTTRVR